MSKLSKVQRQLRHLQQESHYTDDYVDYSSFTDDAKLIQYILEVRSAYDKLAKADKYAIDTLLSISYLCGGNEGYSDGCQDVMDMS